MDDVYYFVLTPTNGLLQVDRKRALDIAEDYSAWIVFAARVEMI